MIPTTPIEAPAQCPTPGNSRRSSFLTRLTATAALSLFLMLASAAAFGQPVIQSAGINYATGEISISGSNLLPASGSPVVVLNGTTLTLVSSSNTQIVADIPMGLPEGTLRLTVGSTVFEVAYGATGPGSLTLPFSATAAGTNVPVFNLVNSSPGQSAIAAYGAEALAGSGNGGRGISGYGGNSNGVSAGDANDGGAGLYGIGGEGVNDYDTGGKGVHAVGGAGLGFESYGGAGIEATGGASTSTGFAGDGLDAYGGAGGTAGFGIFAEAGTGAGPLAGWFDGAVEVIGALSKSSGSFKIDHPLDPANKYLYHSFVESPDMMNIYNGNVTTDASGTAVINMPAWFEALNTDFRYQLTVLGQFAQAIVASEMANGSFTIKTNKPGVKVSWQVTGIRQDAWAIAHRIQVEVDKAQRDQGHYIHPELFGHEGEPSIAEMHHPRPPAAAPRQ